MDRYESVMITSLKDSLPNAWSQETAYDPAKWDPQRPSIGQCAVTALMTQDILGGKIMRCTVGDTSHYYNDVNGEILDLTAEQFDHPVDYSNGAERTREEILNDFSTMKRYAILLLRNISYLNSKGYSRNGN